MSKSKNKKASCPECRCRYRVPEEFLGRMVSCKTCGTNFKIIFQNKSDQKEVRQADSCVQEEAEEILSDDAYLVIGKLAVKYKFARVDQVKKALSIKERETQAGKKVSLGKVMVDHGILSPSQRDFLHSVQKMLETRASDAKFGVFAIKNDFAGKDQIEKALKEQKKIFKETQTLKKIGEILVESGVMSEEQRDAILLKQKRLEKKSPVKQKRSDTSGSTAQAEIDDQFELIVPEDRLNAFILPVEDISNAITVEDVKHFIGAKGINFGIVADAKIAEYLQDKDSRDEPWEIAKGKPPEPGEDAQIKYAFETDPLKVGAVKDGGSIDFKDRGEIPQVNRGVVLAEKIPGQEGSPGKDVYGNPIPAPKPKDTKLRRSKGTTLSDDKLKVLAKTDGLPKVTAFGEIYVLPKLDITGDVGLGTGHVEFDGNINVAGTIHNGFRVKGGSLTAKEILKAQIEMTGDIVVYGGIIGATIKTEGNVKATYVHDADIEALGNVVVDKEIIDSTIDCSGECCIKGGTILSSVIAAKKGIQASQVGSEISKPCNLTVGVDENAKHKIDEVKEAISQKQWKLKEYRTRLEEIEEMPDKIETQVGEMAQVQDRAMVQQRNLKKEVEELIKANDQSRRSEVEKEFMELDLEIKEAEKTLEALFNEQDQITDKISNIRQKISNAEEEVQELKDKIEGIIEWSKNEKGTPEVKVTDTIFPDTTIAGIYSTCALKQIEKNVLIKEQQFYGSDDMLAWKMKISPLK